MREQTVDFGADLYGVPVIVTATVMICPSSPEPEVRLESAVVDVDENIDMIGFNLDEVEDEKLYEIAQQAANVYAFHKNDAA